MSNWPATAAFVVLAACGFVTAGCGFGSAGYACTTNEQCGAGGTCETSFGGYCSFTDPNCDSGRRFGDLAGDKSGQCVGGQTPIGIDASIDTPPDAQTCFGTGIVKICLQAAPTMPVTISSSTTINTATSNLCAAVASGGDFCVLAGTTISIESALRATGTRPLVLLATDSISITAPNGLVDVGSHRGATPEIGAAADDSTCVAATAPMTNNGSSGGGAGGSFVGLGGNGSDGGSNNGGSGGTPGTAVTAASVVALRGGCPGQDGAGTDKGVRGHGGGAVFLIAGNTVDVQGKINAAGEGGGGGVTGSAGGGGAGAGGMIGFDATTITVGANALVLANGGGAGEGSTTNGTGEAGADPTSTNAAGGGNNRGFPAGRGGNGSPKAAAAAGGNGGNAGAIGNNVGGGGGGGGGAGLIKVPAGVNLGNNTSPASTQ